METSSQQSLPSAAGLEASSSSSFTTSDQQPPVTNSQVNLPSSQLLQAAERPQARPLSELLSETGLSSPKLAEETGIAYTTIRHLATRYVRRPKEENARAILTVLNYYRAKSTKNLPLLKLEDVEEFAKLRTNTPSADKLARLTVAADTASSPRRTRKSKKKAGDTNQPQPGKPGRPLGRKNKPKPGLSKPLGAKELFLSEFVIGNLPQYVLLPQTNLQHGSDEEGHPTQAASGSTRYADKQQEEEAQSHPTIKLESLTNTPTRATRLLDRAIEELRQNSANLSLTPQTFMLKTTQAALADPTLQTSLGQVEVQLVARPNPSEPVIRLSIVKAGSEANKPSRVELTLSLEEFTQLSLLQLHLLKQTQTLPTLPKK